MTDTESEVDNKEVDNDAERLSIKAELSSLSFAELQKLKETIGSKVYNEAMFGKKKVPVNTFKRENKNRPREVSSKIPVKHYQSILPVKKKVIRDPRFDSLCGKYDHRTFQKAYGFIRDLKSEEKKELKIALESTKNPKEQAKIMYLIRRIENQEREESRRMEKERAEQEQRKEALTLLKQGRRPYYKSKRDTKMTKLMEKYMKLKKSSESSETRKNFEKGTNIPIE